MTPLQPSVFKFMLMILKYNQQKISYVIKRSQRARRIRLTVYQDKRVVVTLPQNLSAVLAEQFVQQKAIWIWRKLNHFKNSQKSLLAKYNPEEYRHYKEKVRQIILSKLNYLNQVYDFPINQVRIKNQRTIWGSCSKKGNLNFNYKIMFLPDKLADYIIVHEICHLKELNHSPQFWSLVGRSFSNYQVIKKQLRHTSFI